MRKKPPRRASLDEVKITRDSPLIKSAPSTSPATIYSLLMRQLIGAGTPRETVVFVLLTPTGAMLVARGVSQSGQTAFAAAFLIWE